MERISRALEKAAEPLSQRQVEAAVTGKVSYVRQALTTLITDGYVERSAGSGRAFLHKSIKPYHDPASQPPIDYTTGGQI